MSKISEVQENKKGTSLSFIIVILLMILLATISIQKFVNPSITSVSIAKWRGGATAAYSIIHDDLCNPECDGIINHADTIAKNRNIRIGAGAYLSLCVDRSGYFVYDTTLAADTIVKIDTLPGDSIWVKIQRMVDNGHEILSHSWNHKPSVALDWSPEEWSNDTDVVLSKKIIEENLENAEASFFIFPYDAYNDKRLAELKEAGYLGARAGKAMYQDRGINTRFNNFDPFRSNFDAYMSQEEQDEIHATEVVPYDVSLYDDNLGNVAIQHMNAAIQTHGWSLQEMHSVANKKPWGWGHISVKDYQALLDHAVAMRKEGKLWIDTPTRVIKYIMTLNGLGDASYKQNSIHFSGLDTLDKKYATDVTLSITTRNNPKDLYFMQGDRRIKAEKREDNLFTIDINPLLGELTFQFKK